ncbi:MAG: hypothetical protein ACYC1C_09630 [Chloroflexota bacterium]
MRTLAALPRRTLVATALLIVILLGWQVWAANAAGAKLTPEVRQAVADGGRAYVAVRLGFEPEQFHMTYFQEKARVVGVKGEWIYVQDVDAAALSEIASQYWVQDIQLVRSP